MSAKPVTEGDELYHRLDVEPWASQQEIRRAYLRLAPSAHPDLHPDDPDASPRFRELTHAYKILGDPHQRARYDQLRQSKGHADRPSGPESTPRRAGTNVWLGTSPANQFPSPPTGTPPLFAGPVRIHAPVGIRSDSFFQAVLYGWWR
jgi:curved DNA-binding protein CbpA